MSGVVVINGDLTGGFVLALIWAMAETGLSASVKHMLKKLLLPVIIALSTAVFQATFYTMQMKS